MEQPQETQVAKARRLLGEGYDVSTVATECEMSRSIVRRIASAIGIDPSNNTKQGTVAAATPAREEG